MTVGRPARTQAKNPSRLDDRYLSNIAILCVFICNAYLYLLVQSTTVQVFYVQASSRFATRSPEPSE